MDGVETMMGLSGLYDMTWDGNGMAWHGEHDEHDLWVDVQHPIGWQKQVPCCDTENINKLILCSHILWKNFMDVAKKETPQSRISVPWRCSGVLTL